MARDKRLGRTVGETREYPEVTLLERELPQKPYSTIGLEDGYFVVINGREKADARDKAVLELTGIVQSYKVNPKAPAKSIEETK
jgi:hypothetical protein